MMTTCFDEFWALYARRVGRIARTVESKPVIDTSAEIGMMAFSDLLSLLGGGCPGTRHPPKLPAPYLSCSVA